MSKEGDRRTVFEGQQMTHAGTATVACSGPTTLGLNRGPAVGVNPVPAPTGGYRDGEGTSVASPASGATVSPSGGVFYLQDPSAPPLSRGGSAASSSRDRGDESGFPISPDTSQNHRHPWRDRVKPLPLPPSKDGRPHGGAPEHTSVQPSETQLAIERPHDSFACRKASVVKVRRSIMSRRFRDTILVQDTIEPHSAGMDGVGGCCGLCRAPSRMPCCASILPCCSYPEALEEVRRESNYLIIRENAVEFNKSRVVMGSRPAATTRISPARAVNGQGHYVGACGCTYHVQDDARVLYFDDPVMDDVEARTSPCCIALRRCLCGSRGQAVRVQSRICYGGCVRTRGLHGLPCIPACCVCLCGPAALRYDMPAKDAADAAAKIVQARDNALTRMRRDDDAHAAVPFDAS